MRPLTPPSPGLSPARKLERGEPLTEAEEGQVFSYFCKLVWIHVMKTVSDRGELAGGGAAGWLSRGSLLW